MRESRGSGLGAGSGKGGCLDSRGRLGERCLTNDSVYQPPSLFLLPCRLHTGTKYLSLYFSRVIAPARRCTRLASKSARSLLRKSSVGHCRGREVDGGVGNGSILLLLRSTVTVMMVQTLLRMYYVWILLFRHRKSALRTLSALNCTGPIIFLRGTQAPSPLHG